jgi:hypothetical protein
MAAPARADRAERIRVPTKRPRLSEGSAGPIRGEPKHHERSGDARAEIERYAAAVVNHIRQFEPANRFGRIEHFPAKWTRFAVENASWNSPRADSREWKRL